MADWLIYGANGYTGELIAREAVARGLRPTLAGRNGQALNRLGSELGLPVRVFRLDDPTEVAQHLRPYAALLHCAGPFVQTSRPMVEACLQAGVHYLDITGEYTVFEALAGLDRQARAAAEERAKQEAVQRIGPDQLAQYLYPIFDSKEEAKSNPLGKGLPAGPGAAAGKIRGSGRSCTRRGPL